ncbi:hypothetical protein RSSM_02262 [Rhodopirellula sallentina SM41]|uniref:Uncharacterized protein n=1 Tax=Rhodopirellula sallentina SM41 TaxID=1263870 RepID=M5U4W8_9BACT|nr:hypothetical protein RSSM_02262 [Rhodopirellula sallentina SM41]
MGTATGCVALAADYIRNPIARDEKARMLASEAVTIEMNVYPSG